ncbi:hypothetical protein P7H06_25885 [Paenibacillus larvae]|nr:hypothetical protein [Paenibacillus larvae]MDT2262233.1 hypothetical protein [Paenibacillus larvae]
MKLTPVPELSDIEKMILGEVVCGSVLSTVAVKYMPESIMDAATGTAEERMTLRDKVITWSAAERIAAIESLGVAKWRYKIEHADSAKPLFKVVRVRTTVRRAGQNVLGKPTQNTSAANAKEKL